jgi:hypothetical protein
VYPGLAVLVEWSRPAGTTCLVIEDLPLEPGPPSVRLPLEDLDLLFPITRALYQPSRHARSAPPGSRVGTRSHPTNSRSPKGRGPVNEFDGLQRFTERQPITYKEARSR